MPASTPIQPAFLSMLTVLLSVSVNVRFATAEDGPTAKISTDERDFFEKQVRPILVKRCFECHGGTRAGGGLSLASAKGWALGGESGPAIVPGKVDESLLIQAINYRTLEMPPADKGGRLPDAEISVLTQWVQRGAPDPRDGSDVLGGMTLEEARRWWAFQPLPEVPAAGVTADAQHIDSLIRQEADRHGLKVSGAADLRTLLRRLSFDLTGLPPSAEEVDAFVASSSADAWTKAIEHFLESPQYGVQWGRHWMDVVRYADTAGENTDRPLPHAWKYRNWVMDRLHDDTPFDQFIRMQLAGDLLTADQSGRTRTDGLIATGYLAIARRFGHDIDKDMYLTHEDVIDNLGRNFLGLSLGCARCHEHKYDPVSSQDYYALYGIFESTKFAFPGCEPKGQPRDLVPLVSQSEIESIRKSWEARQAQYQLALQRRSELSKRVFTPDSAKAARVVQSAAVGEGASVDLVATRLPVHSGDIILLTIEPGENHGADSTLAELNLADASRPERQWSTRDVIPTLTESNPRQIHDATWCFLEVTPDGPVFLSESGETINGQKALQKWSLGDTPSVFVNSSDQDVSVWTTLAAQSFFAHPGQNRPVALAWISPIDGEVVISGRIADAHPAGLDGVKFRLEHVADPKAGFALREAGRISHEKLPDSEPEPVIPVAYAVVDQEARNVRIHERGDPEKPGAEVPRRWLSVFGGTEVAQGSGSGRRELSDWVSRNPLAARVMVNRIWGWHFGKGLVRSPNDFGARGEPPTHPELLDFLAARFVQSGFSVKAMHRLILQTQAFQRASAVPGANDPENQWLSHYSRRRLSAEELRDSLLKVSGQLDQTPGEAHPFPDEKTWTFSQHAPFNAVYETRKRSAFMMVQRQRRHPFLALFDGADPNASTPLRQSTMVPTQALYFLNDAFFHEQALAIAEPILVYPDESVRMTRLWSLLLQRSPSPEEVQRFHAFLESYPAEERERWSSLVRILLASNEFLFVE